MTRIAHAAGGNPLFVTEMVAMAAQSRERTCSCPPNLQALLAARLDQLEAPERSVLERGAVEGEVFHRGAVQALSDDGQVVPRLVALVRKELIRPDQASFPARTPFASAPPIRDAAYDALPKSTRAELHGVCRLAGGTKRRARRAGRARRIPPRASGPVQAGAGTARRSTRRAGGSEACDRRASSALPAPTTARPGILLSARSP